MQLVQSDAPEFLGSGDAQASVGHGERRIECLGRFGKEATSLVDAGLSTTPSATFRTSVSWPDPPVRHKKYPTRVPRSASDFALYSAGASSARRTRGVPLVARQFDPPMKPKAPACVCSVCRLRLVVGVRRISRFGRGRCSSSVPKSGSATSHMATLNGVSQRAAANSQIELIPPTMLLRDLMARKPAPLVKPVHAQQEDGWWIASEETEAAAPPLLQLQRARARARESRTAQHRPCPTRARTARAAECQEEVAWGAGAWVSTARGARTPLAQRAARAARTSTLRRPTRE